MRVQWEDGHDWIESCEVVYMFVRFQRETSLLKRFSSLHVSLTSWDAEPRIRLTAVNRGEGSSGSTFPPGSASY
jgi:hypothetical protein